MDEPSQAIERLRKREQKLEARLNRLKRDYDITDPDKVNVTPEQIEILQNVLEDFIDSQGNATVKQFRMWVQQNDALDADEKTAIESVLDDLLNQAPSDWRVEGEFGEWLERRIEDAETVNVEIPVAGRTNGEMTQIRREVPETYTEEVPLEAGDDPETMTVERSNPRSSMEEMQEFNGKLNQMRSETTRREQDRANQRREKQANAGAIPQYDYLNDDGREVDESNIPVPGEGKMEDDR